MSNEPLPGKSLMLYRLFAENSGRWSTPTWMYGVDTRPRWVRADKDVQSPSEPMKIASHS